MGWHRGRRPIVGVAVVGVAVAGVVLTSCTTAEDAPGAMRSQSGAAPSPPAGPTFDPAVDAAAVAAAAAPRKEPAAAAAARRRWAPAISLPVEDSVFPEYGDPRVDALHYDLALAWRPGDRVLTGTETLTFRAVTRSDVVPLDLSKALDVTSATLDGRPVEPTRRGDHVDVPAAVRADSIHTLRLQYSGTPTGTGARFRQGSGVQLGPEGELATFQQPYGAFTWYAVNDQPGDKAFYDFTLDAPEPWTGVANGSLEGSSTRGGVTRTTWHLDQPASSYLTTVGFGEHVRTDLEPVNGVPVTVWTPPENQAARRTLRYGDDALRWAEELLGPYPFDSLSFLVTAGASGGMETQATITFADVEMDEQFRSVVVHEVLHQWWGDLVTPADWRDVWMNEGMAFYLQQVWEAERDGISVDEALESTRQFAGASRERAGPPGDYRPQRFGGANIYDSPALMWHELRGRLGDEVFWELVREWPQQHRFRSVTREELVSWWSQQSGDDLAAFFGEWLDAPELPAS